MRIIFYHDAALAEAKAAIHYYDKISRKLGDQFEERIKKARRQIEKYPNGSPPA